MPDATITSSESTFGTISGTFSSDQSTVTGTISGVITGTLTGSVGVPGPAGPAGIGLPAGGTSGQFLQKTSGVDYATDWVTVNLTGLATESWVTAGFYPLTGNPSGFLTSSSLTPYLTKADNLGSLTNFATARSNLSLGTLNTPVFAGVTAQGSGSNVANLTPSALSITHATFGNFTIQPSSGITFPDSTVQTTAFTTSQLTAYLAKASNLSDLASTSTARTNLGLGSLAVVNDAPSDGSQYARKNGAWDVVTTTPDFISSVSSPLSVTSGNLTIDLSAYAPIASPIFTGDARAVTPTFGDNDTSIATTAFVQSALLGGTAVARNLEVEVRNQSGSTIPAGSIVYISGATGNKPLITLAQANNDANSAQTIGFVKTSIANNGTGFVIVRGELENIDTSALTEGVQLYLSPTTAGTWTTTKPSAPQHMVYVGVVIRSHPTLGTILVAVMNGLELEELHNVAALTPANNDLLAYESSTDLWKNKTYSALGLLTSADAASTYAPKASPTFTGLATFNNPGNYAITLDNISGYYTSISSGVYSIFNASTEVIRLSSGGIKFPDGNTQSVAFPGFTGYAPLASPSFTGNVTITSNSTGAALFIEQSGTGNILTLHDQASDTNFVAIDQNGKVNTIPSTTTAAGFNVPHATAAPTTPVNGDIWTTTSGLFMRQNGSTKQYVDLDGTQTINGTKTFSAANQTLGNATATGTIAVGTGATLSGSIKTVQIGTGGVAGSTTNITIGSTTGTSTTTLQGSTVGVTLAADTNTTGLATTAFVVGQAGSAAPLVNGTAAVGTSLRFARQDHVHPTDTTRLATANSLSELTATASTARTNLGLGSLAIVNDAPSDGSQYARKNGAWDVVTGGGGGASTDYQAYTTAGTFTWTKPANAKWVEVVMFGGGGGGGAGGRYATSSARSGGGAGAGGGVLIARMAASSLGSTETVVVGSGGAGALSITSDTTAGGNGTAGGNSTFSIFQATGGGAGPGGSTAGTTGGISRGAWINGTSTTGNISGTGGVGNTAAGGAGSTVTYERSYNAGGGGGGAGQAATVTTATAGGAGGSKNASSPASGFISAVAGGAGGTTAGVSPVAGVNGAATTGGSGGGGGAYRTAVAGMAGAAGGFPGGGGGGGAASDNGFASGAGGAGGVGAVYIITYC